MRAYRSTSTYPAYKHTSFNLERRGRTTVHLAFHVRYSYADRGFWFGLRPEINVHRHAERVEALHEKLRDARMRFTCAHCGKQEYGPPGMHHPDDWDFIHRLDFCGECVDTCTYRELLKPPRRLAL